MELKDIIKYNRKKKKYTLIKLAELADISYGMLYRLEDGSIIRPHPSLIQKIAKPLGLNYETLLKKCGGVASVQLHKEKRNEIPIIDSGSLFLKKPLLKKSLKVLSQIKGEYVLECPSEMMLPICKKGDFFVIEEAEQLVSNNVYLVKKDKSFQLVMSKREKYSKKNVIYKYPYFFEAIKFNEKKELFYLVKAVISSSMIHYATSS